MIDFKFDKKTDDLFEAILGLKDKKDAEAFFRDLCTIDEIQAMTERWQIAKLLAAGASYRDIANKLNVSTTTVSRVALWLNNGEGGYRMMLERLGLITQEFYKNLYSSPPEKE
ncbi:MAG: YerC/YecD family TrpR-related protein [Patescibacteria group bacterium]|nr:YerC/YecD family TrpR-related protein [Patescibacteria group bacterium]MDD4610851.1 YerC/YecD family TrpR-related protein [Patescibacteria group bacterium]